MYILIVHACSLTIQHEVDNWDPTTDTMPIHSWIHPWLPIMSESCTYVMQFAISLHANVNLYLKV